MAKNKEEKEAKLKKALDLLDKHLDIDVSGYKMWQDTGITEATISNYRNSNTKPKPVYVDIIIDYFESGKYLMKSEEEKMIGKKQLITNSIVAEPSIEYGLASISGYDKLREDFINLSNANTVLIMKNAQLEKENSDLKEENKRLNELVAQLSNGGAGGKTAKIV